MSTQVPAPIWSNPITDERGYPSRWFRVFLQQAYELLTRDFPATAALASGAAPGSVTVTGGGGLHGGGAIGANTAVSLYRARTSVALLPVTGISDGDWGYAVNGRKPAEGAGVGTGVPCSWSRGAWISIYSGVAVTA